MASDSPHPKQGRWSRMLLGGALGAVLGLGVVHLNEEWRSRQQQRKDNLGYPWNYIRSRGALAKALSQLAAYRVADERTYKRIGDLTDHLCSMSVVLEESVHPHPKIEWMYANVKLYTRIQEQVEAFHKAAIKWMLDKRPLEINPETLRVELNDPLTVTDLTEAKELFLGLVSDVHYHNAQLFNFMLKGIGPAKALGEDTKRPSLPPLNQAVGMVMNIMRP